MFQLKSQFDTASLGINSTDVQAALALEELRQPESTASFDRSTISIQAMTGQRGWAGRQYVAFVSRCRPTLDADIHSP